MGAETENDPPKRVFLDLGTDREPSVADRNINCEYEFGMMVLVNSLCTRVLDYLMLCLLVLPYYSLRSLIEVYLNLNKSYSLNPVCPKFISNKRVFRKIEVRIFELSLYIYGLYMCMIYT